MSLDRNPEFLKKKYGSLHTSPEVQNVLRARAARSGEAVPRQPLVGIQAYLDRFCEVIESKDPAKRVRGIEAMKRLVACTAVIQPENIPESVFVLEQRIARELGHGTVEMTDEFREKKIQEIVNNQRESLNKWINYLVSTDAKYPDWVKYWVFRSMLDMGKFQKEEDEDGRERAVFKRRTKDTAAPFPPLNQAALAKTVDAIIDKLKADRLPLNERIPLQNLSKRLNQQAYDRLLATEDFSKIYTQFLIEMPAYSTEGLEETRGKWVKYLQGSDPQPLVDSLDGYPLEWCTAGLETAKNQLNGGDFYVYYSLDEENEPRIPRVAIRMEADKIAEVRGIAPNQNLDPYIGDVVQKKMGEFPDGEIYQKKARDMKLLTAIEKKEKLGMDLTRAELVFLYEIHSKIEGFGYERDPRIEELRSRRNPKEDAPVVFECQPNEIASSQDEVTKHTKAYVGPLFKDIFKTLAHVEHVYTSFPEGKITRQSLEIGGQTASELEGALERAGFKISDYARSMLKHKDFTTENQAEQTDLVRLTVDALFNDGRVHTTDEVFSKAKDFGLELCPAEVGPHLRLNYKDQPLDEWVYVAMKQITDPDGGPRVFYVERGGGGSWLYDSWADPGYEWDPEDRFVFRLCK